MLSHIEMVSFEVNDEGSEQAILSLQNQLNLWLKDREGFQYRTLVKDTDGRYLDFVHWASPEAAQSAASELPCADFAPQFMACVKNDSIHMRHVPAVSEIGYDAD